MGLYLLIFLHLSALMNRLALSDLLMKSCSKFQSKISNHLDKVLSFFMAPSLWNSLPATLRNVPTLSQFKRQLKNLVCTGLPVESEEMCVCVAVECRWMHMDRERGKGRGGESMRDLGKRRRHGLGG